MVLFPMAKLKSLRCPVLTGICVLSTLSMIFIFNTKHNFYIRIPAIPAIRKLDLQYVVVHFDLKGAPPNLNFLGSLLPMIKNGGANAILMEYEDMFPYEGDLVHLSSPNCYNRTELKEFLKLAKDLDMEVMPLVQTFGHLEFVLKLPEYTHLRENPEYPESICPNKNDSHSLIKNMVEQIIKFHNDVELLKHIHVGIDEVYNIGECPDCRSTNLSHEGILLEHISRVVSYVKELSPSTTVLVWDDMLRKIKPHMWSKLEVSYKKPFNIIEPVYWEYGADPPISHITLRQHHIHYDNIWVATAFKGADGVTNIFPHIGNRFANNYRWLRNMYNYKFSGLFSPKEMIKFKGIILTGWSRYKHFEPLCELLPVSLPSLFLNLVVVKKFQDGFPAYTVLDHDWLKMFNKHFYDDIKKKLDCSFDVETADLTDCKSVGQLYQALSRFMNFTQHTLNRLYVSDDSVLPVLSYYLQKNNVQKRTLQNELLHCKSMDLQLKDFKMEMNYYLSKFYNRDVVDEYINSKTFEITERLTGLMKKMETICNRSDKH